MRIELKIRQYISKTLPNDILFSSFNSSAENKLQSTFFEQNLFSMKNGF